MNDDPQVPDPPQAAMLTAYEIELRDIKVRHLLYALRLSSLDELRLANQQLAAAHTSELLQIRAYVDRLKKERDVAVASLDALEALVAQTMAMMVDMLASRKTKKEDSNE